MKISLFKGTVPVLIIIVTLLALWTVDYFHPFYGNLEDISSTPLRLVFVGDIMLSRNVGDIISREGPEFPFANVHDILQRGDITMGNLESPISGLNTTVCEKSDTGFCFKASPDSIQGLSYAGFDIMTVANNHALDYKPEVLNDTLTRLSAAGIGYTGAQQSRDEHIPRALILKDRGMNVGFLGFNDIGTSRNIMSYPQPWNASEENVVRGVKKAREEADIVVVNFHFGEEYNFTHSLRQEKLAHLAADAGATVIIGHHPHVIQDIEVYKGSIIAYSLGNFIFDQKGKSQKEGSILTVEIDPVTKQVAGYSLDRVNANNEFQPIPGFSGMIISYYERLVSRSFSKLKSIIAKNPEFHFLFINNNCPPLNTKIL
jgi:poly-gamma-glutamate synthesis protein (capsule biosynthesis protein)